MNIIEFLKIVVFGIVEGFTEWLPISSTGHMILLNEFVTLDVSPEFFGGIFGRDTVWLHSCGRGPVLEEDIPV